MNLLAKTGPWLAASLFAASSLIGQTNNKCAPTQKSFEQGHEMMQNQMMAGYNAPARIDVRGAWDFYADASFTYWQPIQENMELGVVSSLASPLVNGNVVNMHFKYKPGFKVGLGMNFDHDNWDTHLQYTWFRGTTTQSTTTSGVDELLSMWGEPNFTSYVSGSEKWKLHMDLLDLELARSNYVGTKLSVRPFFAARAAWIRQNVHVTYDGTTSADHHKQTSHSWGVGPRMGLYSNWMIGEGFRMYGNGAGDILFTEYTKLRSNTTTVTHAGVSSAGPVINQRNLFGLRTHLELEIGFGWGSYFDNNNWHVDLSAGYGFQVFFDQNMFRKFVDDLSPTASLSPNGNLYVHGLTANVRFDF